MLDPDHLDETSEELNRPRRSGGPRTPEGKGRSSQNSVEHGCRSHIVILPGEEQQDFDDLYDRWYEAYQPDTGAALELFEQLVLNKWYLIRNERHYSDVQFQLSFFPFTKWDDGQHKIYQLALRYKTAAERSASKAQRDLEDYFKNRRAEDKYRHQLEKETYAFQRQLEEDANRREQAVEKTLNDAQARGIDVSQERAGLAQQKKKHRANLARFLDEAAARRANRNPVQLLVDGQHSPKKLRPNTLGQSVEVTVQDGVTVTTLDPSNDQLIERGRTINPPPELVYRRLDFPHGVPEEYAWISDDPLARKYGGFAIQRMPLDTWLDLIEAEKLPSGGHLGPCGTPLHLQQRFLRDCPACNLNRERLEACTAPPSPKLTPEPLGGPEPPPFGH